MFAGFLAVVILLQWMSGAYRAEFGGYPDEPAHYVTSLMVREFITSFKWGSPLQFAQDYYHHYPKVAFGHWPPFFYMIQAVWMMIFSASRTSIRVEIALTAALLAYSVYLESKRWFAGLAAPILAGLLTVCIPLVQLYADEEMSEILLTLLCFWAAIFFKRYLDSRRSRDSLLFGIFFSLAVLTKGNAWLLAGIIPISLLLTRKVRLLARWEFWVAPAVVALLCIPWQVLTLQMAERGWVAGTAPSLQYTLSALERFGMILIQIGGWGLFVLALLGIITAVLVPAIRRGVDTGPAVMFALILCTWIFHAIVPAGVEDRKMLIAVPALVLFIFVGGFWLADRLRVASTLRAWRRPAVAVAAAAAFTFGAFAVPKQTHYGFADAAGFITSQPDLRRETILVSDNSVGEGLLISEVAMNEHWPTNTILRGTKVLAEVDWAGLDYHCRFTSPQQVIQAIDGFHVDLVVIDNFNGIRDLEHNQLLRQALQDKRRFQLIRTFPAEWPGGRTAEIFLYAVRHPA